MGRATIGSEADEPALPPSMDTKKAADQLRQPASFDQVSQTVSPVVTLRPTRGHAKREQRHGFSSASLMRRHWRSHRYILGFTPALFSENSRTARCCGWTPLQVIDLPARTSQNRAQVAGERPIEGAYFRGRTTPSDG
jgi:hypothetical protein